MDRATDADNIRRPIATPDVAVGSVAALTETGSLVVASATGKVAYGQPNAINRLLVLNAEPHPGRAAVLLFREAIGFWRRPCLAGGVAEVPGQQVRRRGAHAAQPWCVVFYQAERFEGVSGGVDGTSSENLRVEQPGTLPGRRGALFHNVAAGLRHGKRLPVGGDEGQQVFQHGHPGRDSDIVGQRG